jgi:pseudouridine-5'-phosphate glycosidase
MEPLIDKASKEAKDKDIHSKKLTPFLLERINVMTHGKAMRANLALLLNNARLAARIARAWRTSELRRAI